MEKATKCPDVNLLAAEIHANAVQHGFWENDPSDEHCLCLVACELAEAVEADRKGKHAFTSAIEYLQAHTNNYTSDEYAHIFRIIFVNSVKDTVEDELADTVIRLLDLAGAHGYDLSRGSTMVGCIHNGRAFTENVWEIIQVLTNKQLDAQQRVLSGVVAVEILAVAYDIDLWQHVQLKMQYNASRPYRHGKKY